MKLKPLILFLCAAGFLLALPVFWIVASLAADLKEFHPVAGWAVWIATIAAVVCLLYPIGQFFRLPSMPPREVWNDSSVGRIDVDSRWIARLLADTCDNPAASEELRRYLRDLPNDLNEAVKKEIIRRRDAARTMRYGAVRQAAMLSILSPHRQLDMLILLWINLRQVYQLSRCYGFKPSPRGIFRLYAGVFGSAVALEAFDEVAEQASGDVVTRLLGGIPMVGDAAKIVYEPVRAAAYVSFVGLLSEYLLKNELRIPPRSERKNLRNDAWNQAATELKKVVAGTGQVESVTQ